MIEVSHCNLAYIQGSSQVMVYDNFDLKIEPGESLVLIGPSGCGKSTLLYLLAGLLRPTGGEIKIWGEKVVETRQKKAFILQEYGLFPWLNVIQNVNLGLRVRHLPKRKYQGIVDEMIHKMGLWEVRHHFPSQLSGGQRQRVALARALTLQPDLLLMDEPLSALDALTRERLQSLLLEIWQEQKLTTVLVTHSIEEAVFLGSRILVLVDGRLIMGYERKIDRFLAPLVYLTYPIPKIVFLPLILLFLGLGDQSKIFLITFIVFFQILVTTRDAVRKVQSETISSLRSLGGNRAQVYRYVLLPASLPDVLTALRLSMGTAIAVLFFAESFATTEGLGYFIMDSWSRAVPDEMFAGIIMMALLGVSLFVVVDLLEKVLCRWQDLKGN